MPEQKTTVTVNSVPVELIDFPREFLTQTALAAVATLKKVEEIRELEISYAAGKSAVTVNGKKIPLGPFPSDLIAATFKGLLSILKGVEKNIDSYQITVGP